MNLLNFRNRLGAVVALAVGVAGSALAQGEPPTELDYVALGGQFRTDVYGIVAAIAPIALGIMILFLGWRLLKRMLLGASH